MKNLYEGDQGIYVEYLQLALGRAGYPVGIDGVFGTETCNALKNFVNTEYPCIVTEAIWQTLIPYLKGYITYKVQSGDTFASLEERFDTSEERILIANRIQDGNLIAGDEIIVPLGFPVVPENVNYSSELLDYIVDGLKARYPDIQVQVIGKSVMGRSLYALVMGSGAKEVFYSAAYHANEWITTPLLLKFAENYAAAAAEKKDLENVDVEQLMKSYTLFVVPMVNPDGVDLVTGALENGPSYRYAQRISSDYPAIPFPEGWKANIEGIDLNLQFPAGWEIAKQIKEDQGFTSPAPRDYVGPEPLYAPESIAVYQYTRRHDFQLILAYHTQGEVIYYKYLNYDPKDADRIALYFKEVSGYELEITPTESGYAGYKDWFILFYNRPGYTVEVGRGQNPLPLSQLPQIYRDNIGILLGGMTELSRETNET